MNDNGLLPADLLRWVEEVCGGSVAGFHRHFARREAWQVDIARDDAQQPIFLRIDRALAAGRQSTRNLKRETELIRALGKQGIPVQDILGWNERHCSALQSWVAGSGDLVHAPRETQHKVMLDFMEILARLHRINPDALDLPDFERPATVLQHSLMEIEAVEEPQLFPQSACVTNPLAAFGKRWLINHAPDQVQATSLVQGDTGSGNFMWKGERVTAVVDWEWGHFGDPMEDLGNVWMRDFLNPASGGDMRPYFEHYAQHSGFRLDYDSIAYYRAHQLLRSVIGLTYLTEHLDWQHPVAMLLGYAAVCNLEACTAMAELSGLPERRPEPLDTGSGKSIHATLAKQMQNLVAPQLEDAFAKTLVEGQAAIMGYLELKSHYQADFDAAELDSLRQLLGNALPNLEEGRQQLLAYIPELTLADERPVLDHLYQMAVNQARLMAPLTETAPITEPWQNCRWARIV